MTPIRILHSSIALLLTILTLCGCGDQGAVEPVTGITGDPVVHSPRMAILDYTNPVTEPDGAAGFARAGLVILESAYLWSHPDHVPFVDEVRSLNPETRVVGYVLAQTTRTAWAEQEQSNPYGYDMYVATLPYWAHTTTGDTLTNWPGQVVLDITDPACRTAMIDVIERYHRQSGRIFDGVMWDAFAPKLWIPPEAAAVMDGEPDIDGDGVPHDQDEDEMAAMRDAQEALVRELRNRLGSGFIQIFNGVRAMSDSSFAALGDGMLYELFPEVGFGRGANYAKALDTSSTKNLFAARRWPRTRNGGPWLILSNLNSISFTDDRGALVSYDLGDINRAVALLTGATVVYHETGGGFYGWPAIDVDLGAPLGPASIDSTVFRREFELGSVTVEMESGAYPIPFDFTIVQDGDTLQALDFPAHTP